MTKKYSCSARSLLIAFVIAFLLTPFTATAEQDPKDDDGESIKLSATLVEIFLTVKDGKRFVNGLTRDSFEVYEEGVPQNLAFFDTEDLPASVALLLDTSGSMGKSISVLQAAAEKFVEGLKDSDELAVLSFGGMVKELCPLGRDKTRPIAAINRIVAEGSTSLYDGIVRGLMKLESGRGRRAIVLITDGADTSSQLSAETVIRLSGRLAIPLFIIGTGDALKELKLKKSLEEISERSGGKAFFLNAADEMPRAFAEISANLKASYRTGYYVNRAPDGKWRTITVKLKSGKGEVVTRQGYYAGRKYPK
jgi:Ca-activated chloride channel homolog